MARALCGRYSAALRSTQALSGVQWDVVIQKGRHEGAYSGFDGRSLDDMTLATILTNSGVRHVTVVGFATDHCVKATALDARDLGFDVDVRSISVPG